MLYGGAGLHLSLADSGALQQTLLQGAGQHEHMGSL